MTQVVPVLARLQPGSASTGTSGEESACGLALPGIAFVHGDSQSPPSLFDKSLLQTIAHFNVQSINLFIWWLGEEECQLGGFQRLHDTRTIHSLEPLRSSSG